MIHYRGAKMSKSKGNVISPDEMIERHGADTVRLYTLFLGPPEQDAEWTDGGVGGAHRFLSRSWRIVGEIAGRTEGGIVRSVEPEGLGLAATTVARKAHWAIAKVSDDIERRFHFNTAIAACMELLNAVDDANEAIDGSPEDGRALRFAATTLVSLLQPFAPHIAEELWESLGGTRLWDEPWPAADERFLERDTFVLVVQVNGKLRGRVEVPSDASRDDLLAAAKAHENVQAHLGEDATIVKEIVVPGKLVNLVVR
jgi:leucyl-tRNA synthetase